ncbi:MAG: hypothetical protein ACXVZH_14445 [Terriglobales bacterium]
MSKYLAVILGFCALTTPSLAAAVVRAQLPQLNQETQPTPEAAPAASPQDSPQNTAPASPAAAPAQSSPAPQSEPASPPETKPAPESTPEPQKAQPESAAKKPESKTSKKAVSKKKRHRKSCASPSPATTEKKVVPNGGTADPVVQLAPTISAEQASSQRQSTAQLLTATEDNLKQIASRQLNSTQQDSVSQIRKYMEQAKAAEATGDVPRAHNLASKALLLSDDLVKH